MRKSDLPFTIAFFVALALHFVAGVALKYGNLGAAVPIPAQPQAPISLNFVEVPPNATTVQQAPPAKFLSDANRKAGPLKANNLPTKNVPQVYGRPGPPRKAPSAPAIPQMAQAPTPAKPSPAPTTPETIGSEGPKIGNPQQLSRSLENLDKFIPTTGSNGSPGSAGGDGGDGGNIPGGDPGSGVFFDTQGYDLGPWANRAVEIVRSNWIIPVAADLGMKGVVGISFKIDRSGRIFDLKVVSQSGVPSFDQAAYKALQASSPLPSLPADFPRDVLPGVFRFYYNTAVPN